MTPAADDPTKPERFYAESMNDEDQARFMRALDLQGIDEEVAILRVTLRRLFDENPRAHDKILKNAGMLIKAVAAQYRLSPKSAHDFAERFTSTLRDLGEQIAPGMMGGDDV